MTINDITKILPLAWVPRQDLEWFEELYVKDEPATGQCAVTALVLQDYFGGEIVNSAVLSSRSPGITSSHYFNIIDGKIVDLTRRQFVADVTFSPMTEKLQGFESTREYMLSYPSTVERYDQLKANVEKLLATRTAPF